MNKKPILLIHGGATSSKKDHGRKERVEKSLKTIVEKIFPLLRKGLSADRAVVLAVEMLENDPLFNAGLGSKIQSDGKIRMSASLMSGRRSRFSGCLNVQRIKNPIFLAEKLMEFDSRVLSEKGAERFAREAGLVFSSPFTKQQVDVFKKKKMKGKYGTVGAVVLDKNGFLAAATSTGGRGMEYPHRVSDSPTAAGNWANRKCAVSATGIGEEIVEQAVASSICVLVDNKMSLDKAANYIVKNAKRRGAQFGFIAVDHRGKVAVKTTTEGIIWALASTEGFKISP